MASKTITVTEEAYERLKAHKREGESFTETLLRLTEETDPMDGFGAMADVEGFRETVEGSGERLDEDLRERADRRAE